MLHQQEEPYKVIIRLKAIGSAPILKHQVFKLSSQNTFLRVVQFIRKELALKESDSIFLYVNSAFIPQNDDLLGDLDKLHGTEGQLVINYATNPAFG
jgi:ubiquitin-like protein ATG12